MVKPSETQRNFIRAYGQENNLGWAVKGFQPADRSLEAVNSQALGDYIQQQAARTGLYGGNTHTPDLWETQRPPMNLDQVYGGAGRGGPAASPPPDMSRMSAAPSRASSFPNLGARMANPAAFNIPSPSAAAPEIGAMADLRAIGGTLGDALRGVAGKAGGVLRSPVVNNPLTRTAARAAGPLGLALGAYEAYNELADQTSPTNQHAALAGQAWDEGHYGDAAYEGAMAAANTLGAATGLRGLFGGGGGGGHAAPAAARPAGQPSPLAADYLGAHTPSQFVQPGQAQTAAGGPANSMVNNPMYYGDDTRLPIELRLKLAGMSPRPHYTTAADQATQRGMRLAEAIFAARQRSAGNDINKSLANMDELRQAYAAFGVNGRGYTPMWAATPMQAPADTSDYYP